MCIAREIVRKKERRTHLIGRALGNEAEVAGARDLQEGCSNAGFYETRLWTRPVSQNERESEGE